ncbi:hypothetical protein [Scytonema sp. NUACC26]|uniref:hypothetical protein n=1 Tax=Scytonema sp. NUACC26 TaxID=3140176 RepID=UPI0034DCBDA7
MSEEEFTRYIFVIRQQIEALHGQIVLLPTQQQQLLSAPLQLLSEAASVLLKRSLDGLLLLFVDDEADPREYITVVLEQ